MTLQISALTGKSVGDPNNVRRPDSSTGNGVEPPPFPEENLVYQCNDFSIWLSPCLDVWWHTKDSFEPKMEELRKRPEWGEIFKRQTELEALPMRHLSEESQRGFRFQIGNAIFLFLTEQFEEARKTMDGAELFYQTRTAQKARQWILGSGLCSLAAASAFAAAAAAIGSVNIFCPVSLLERTALGAYMGALGSFISLVRRIAVLGVDATAGSELHYLEAGCRILTGTIAGGLSVCALAAGVIVPKLADVGPPIVVLLGFVAGFSERWIPSLIDAVMSATQQAAKVSTEAGRTARIHGEEGAVRSPVVGRH